MFETMQDRRRGCRADVRTVFGATADLYYEHWGEFFHLAIFEQEDGCVDWDAALERTHQRYFQAIGGAHARRILELACGGGAFSAWMAERTSADVLGVDISDAQLAHAYKRLKKKQLANLRFIEHDIMHIAELDEAPFDAAVWLDAACYLPDKHAALKGVATRLHKGARLLLVDWCRAKRPTALQEEMLLEPFYGYWGIPAMETVGGYEQAFKAAGFRVLELEDLSERVASNWERGYQIALKALAEPTTVERLAEVAVNTIKYGRQAVQLAKNQFNAAMFAKAAADAGLLRYVYFLAEKE